MFRYGRPVLRDGKPRSVKAANGHGVVHAWHPGNRPVCYTHGKGPWVTSDDTVTCGRCLKRTISPWHPSNRKG